MRSVKSAQMQVAGWRGPTPELELELGLEVTSIP